MLSRPLPGLPTTRSAGVWARSAASTRVSLGTMGTSGDQASATATSALRARSPAIAGR